MRVISGKFKGKNLSFVSNEELRPTANMVRQALFTKLQFEISGKRFLDLFAGSGAIGIEALSRGAGRVVFVDKSPLAINIIKQNISNTITGNRQFGIVQMDFRRALETLLEEFDFIFLDPPYKSNFYLEAASLILKNNLLSNGGMLICEHEAKSPFEISGFKVISRKKYGTKMLSYFMKEEDSQLPPNSD